MLKFGVAGTIRLYRLDAPEMMQLLAGSFWLAACVGGWTSLRAGTLGLRSYVLRFRVGGTIQLHRLDVPEMMQLIAGSFWSAAYVAAGPPCEQLHLVLKFGVAGTI